MTIHILAEEFTRHLVERHRKEWLESGVDNNVISLNVHSVEHDTELKQLLLDCNPQKRWRGLSEICPGWWVGGVDPLTGDDVYTGQYKPDSPWVKNGKTLKYLSPFGESADPLFLKMQDPDFWPTVVGSTAPVILTEGAKKAGAGLSCGVPTVSVPGVYNSQIRGRLRPELQALCKLGRPIYLAYDADLWQKAGVWEALLKTGRLLAQAGAVPYVLQWPPEHKGLDDWLVSVPQGDRQRTLETAMSTSPTLEEFMGKAREEGSEPEENCGLKKIFYKVRSLLGGRLAWNELTHQIEIDGQPIQHDFLRLHLALEFNLDIRKADAELLCSYLAKQSSYHPIRDYLAQCPKISPDFLDKVAPEILGTSDPLHIAFVRKFLISAVARVMKPGCKVDSVLILQGAQGAGKSSFFRLLCPDDAWFDDSFGNQSDKDERLKLHESWICEWGELESVFRRRDISSVKSFITCQTDKIRPPYAAKAESFHRPSVLVGSTNQQEFLADSTGNRRYNVIPLTQAVDLERVIAWRDQIWGAAYAAYTAGESWAIPADLYAAQGKANEAFEFSDSWGEILEAWLSRPDNFIAIQDGLGTGDLLEKCVGLSPDRQDRASQMRIADAMKKLGWTQTRKRVSGAQKRIWEKVGTVGTVVTDENTKSESTADTGVQTTGICDNPLSQQERQPTPEGDAARQPTPLSQPCQPCQPVFLEESTLNEMEDPTKTVCSPSMLVPGSTAVVAAAALLYRSTSDFFPLRKAMQSVELIPLEELPKELANATQKVCSVIKVDGDRVILKTSEGFNFTVDREFVELLPMVEYAKR